MANKSNIKVLSSPQALTDIIDVPKASAEVLAFGDLIENDGSGNAQAVDAAENPTFLGVCLAGRIATDPRAVPVMIRGVIRAKVDAASTNAATIGLAFTWKAGANGTDWTLEDATVEGTMHAMEAIAKGAYGKFLIDVPNLATGIFQAVTT